MAQNPVALHPDPASRPRPHRPAQVATPGASEWVSCVSPLATNRSGRTLEKGAGNLANFPAAFQISLTMRRSMAGAKVWILLGVRAGSWLERYSNVILRVHHAAGGGKAASEFGDVARIPLVQHAQCFAHWAASEAACNASRSGR